MKQALAATDAAARFCETIALGIAFIAFIAMVVITATDVILRYAFNSPLAWDYPVVTNYVVIVIYCMAIPAAQRLRSNIGIEILVRRLPPRVREAVSALSSLLIILFCLLIVWTGWGLFSTAWTNDEIVPGVISWPRWPTYLLFPLGFGLLILRLLLDMVHAAMAACGLVAPGAPPPPVIAIPE